MSIVYSPIRYGQETARATVPRRPDPLPAASPSEAVTIPPATPAAPPLDRVDAFLNRHWPRIQSLMLYPGATFAKGNPFLLFSKTTQNGKRIQVGRLFQTADGHAIGAAFVQADPARPTVVFAHGQGKTLRNCQPQINDLAARGFGVLAFDFRGYGRSQGKPSETGLYEDMRAAIRWLDAKHGIPPSQVVLMGGSLGGGVAAHLARELCRESRPPKALVLYSAFTSTPAVADFWQSSRQLPLALKWVPLKALEGIAMGDKVTDRFETVQKLGEVTCPVVVAHGREDRLMPVTMAQQNLEAVRHLRKKLLLVDHAGHNNLWRRGSSQVLDALESMLG